MKIVGIVLVVLGLVALIYGGISYTTRDKVLDVGPIHASVEKQHNIPLSPIIGGLVLIAGALLVVRERAKRGKNLCCCY